MYTTQALKIAASVKAAVTNRLASEDGAGLAEYALLLLLIAVVCVTALTTLGGTISGALNNANGMFN